MTVNLRMVIFFLVVAGLSVGLHVYLVRRLVAPFVLSKTARRRVRWAAGLLVVLFLVAFLARLDAGSAWAAVVQLLGYGYLGAFTVLAVLLAARDLVWVALHGADRLAGGGRFLPRDPSRRRFLMAGANLAILGAAGLDTGLGFAASRRKPKLVRVSVPIAGLHPALEGFRIAQVSDLHVGSTVPSARLAEVVAQVNALGPDLVAVTGDLVDGSVADLAGEVAPVADFRSRHGTFFVTGNHEYYSGVLAWCEHLGWLGVRVLNDAHAVLEHEGARLLVAGVTDFRSVGHAPGHLSDPRAALADAPETDLRLLLAHNPKNAFVASEVGFDLQMSGHTHGGQYFPFTWIIRLVLPFVEGMYRVAGMWLYVNRGTAHWGPPNRFGSTTEVTLYELRAAPEAVNLKA